MIDSEHIVKWNKGRHMNPQIVWFHLYEISIIRKSTEMESRLIVAKGGNGQWLLMSMVSSFWYDENDLKLDRDDGCKSKQNFVNILKNAAFWTLRVNFAVYELYLN